MRSLDFESSASANSATPASAKFDTTKRGTKLKFQSLFPEEKQSICAVPVAWNRRQTSQYIKTNSRATANIWSHHENKLEGVVREKLGILFGHFVPRAQNSGSEFGEFVRETLLLLFRRFVLFAGEVRYNRASHYNCEPRPKLEWPHVINSSVAVHSPPVSATWIWYHHHKHWHHGHYRSRR